MRALIILDIITVTPVSRSSLVDPHVLFFPLFSLTLSRTAFDFYTRSTSTQTSIYRNTEGMTVYSYAKIVFFADIRTASYPLT